MGQVIPKPPSKWPRYAASPEGNRARFDCIGDVPAGWTIEPITDELPTQHAPREGDIIQYLDKAWIVHLEEIIETPPEPLPEEDARRDSDDRVFAPLPKRRR